MKGKRKVVSGQKSKKKECKAGLRELISGKQADFDRGQRWSEND